MRELAEGSNFPRFRNRPARSGTAASRQSIAYGMGMIVAIDDDLGLTVSHSGGYPGYGSHVLLLPDRGIGIFAFANRTYAGPAIAVWDAAIALNKAGLLGAERALPVSAELESAYHSAGEMYRAGNLSPGKALLAMNFLLDHNADSWAKKLAEVKAAVGDCETATPIQATGAHSGDFTWRCEHGRAKGSLTLAPTRPALIQEWELAPAKP